MTPTEYRSIFRDAKGRACLNGRRFWVHDVAAEHKYWHYTPEEIQEGHSDQPLAAIYSALAYYYDHEAEIEAEWDAADRAAEEHIREFGGNGDLRAKLEARLAEPAHHELRVRLEALLGETAHGERMR